MNRPKVMIVDDNNLILEITGDLFAEAGFDVVKRNKSLGTSAAVMEEKPHCVLLDVNMPGLSGDRMVDIIKKNNSSGIKVYFHSDMGEAELIQMVTSTGADGFFRKSGDKDEMVRKIRSSLII